MLVARGIQLDDVGYLSFCRGPQTQFGGIRVADGGAVSVLESCAYDMWTVRDVSILAYIRPNRDSTPDPSNGDHLESHFTGQ